MKTNVFLFFILISFSIYSQNTPEFEIPNYAPKSPEAEAFLQYGNIPVNLSTGVPNISIPLYTIESKDFRIPLSLDYHSSGIKVDQEATWVGLGWNLTFGAQIVLNVKDDVDENNTYLDAIPTAADLSFYDANPYSFNSGPINNMHLDESRIKDTYTFSSPTCSGQFYIRNFAQNDIVVFPPEAFKVDRTGTRKNLKFTITDKMGNKYIFNTSEKSVRQFTHNDDYLSAWYVDEIKTPINGNIYFYYSNDGGVTEHSSNQKHEIKDECIACGCSAAGVLSNIGPVRTEGGDVTTSTIKIKEILFNNNKSKILFTRLPGRQDLINGNSLLNKLEVQQYNNSTLQFATVKGYRFEYDYFNATGSVDDKRLKLLKVVNLLDESDFHRFVYSDITLPKKHSTSQDYFGYYNGRNNLNMIPEHYFGSPYNATVGSADRTVSSYYSKAAILTELHYPTKGFSKFSYEGNEYWGLDKFQQYKPKWLNCGATGTGAGNNNPTEGESPIDEWTTQCPVNCIQYNRCYFTGASSNSPLRIDVHNNVNDDVTEIKYQYIRVRIYDNDTGLIYDSGKKNKIQSFEAYVSLQGSGFMVVEAWGEHMSGSASLTYVESASSEFKNLAGPGLRIKTIENYTDAITLATKKEYYYDTPGTTNSSGSLNNDKALSFTSRIPATFSVSNCSAGNPFMVNFSKKFIVSEISSSGIEGTGIAYRFVKETSIDPMTSKKNGFTTYEFTNSGDWVSEDYVQIATPWMRGKLIEQCDYKLVNDVPYPIKKVKNVYVDDNLRTSIVEGFKMIRRSSINVSYAGTGYSFPFSSVNGEFGTPKNVLESVQFYNYEFVVPWNYLKSTETTESFYNQSNALTGTIVTNKVFNYNNPTHLQLSSEVTSNSLGETLETKIFYPGDSEVASEPLVTDLINKNMLLPLKIQFLKNAVKLDEKLTKYKNWGNNILMPELLLRSKGALASENDLRFNEIDNSNGNVLEFQIKDGIKTCYIWGYNKTLPVAKIENMSYINIPSNLITAIQTQSDTGTEANLIIALNNLRYDVSMAQSMVTTFIYKPLIGVTSIIDPKGLKITYIYDSQGRLKEVRDQNNYLLSETKYNYRP
jgi:YD repeat-containing protein